MLHLALGALVLITAILALILVFEVWMFVEVVRNPSLTTKQKVLWCLGMLILHPIVAIFYYFLVYAKRER